MTNNAVVITEASILFLAYAATVIFVDRISKELRTRIRVIVDSMFIIMIIFNSFIIKHTWDRAPGVALMIVAGLVVIGGYAITISKKKPALKTEALISAAAAAVSLIIIYISYSVRGMI